VARDRTQEFGEILLRHRERTPFAEVDLVLKKDSLVTLIEVKSSNGNLWGREVISYKQTQRLVRARYYLEAFFQVPTRLLLAVVNLQTVKNAAKNAESPQELLLDLKSSCLSKKAIQYFSDWT
jgi:Holliday junction resolvase-like predicted endonuclease